MDRDFNTQRILTQYRALSSNDLETLLRRYKRRAPLNEADRQDMHEDLKEANLEEEKRIMDKLKKRVLSLRNTQPRSRNNNLNLVLLGKTGAGKSSTGNMLMGQQLYQESSSSESCTAYIQLHSANIDGVRVNLIDTPGLMDTQKTVGEIVTEISKVIEHFSDGIDAFLYVYNIADPRFTAEDQHAFRLISQQVFGADSTEHCFIVLTRVESLNDFTSLKDYLDQDRSSAFKQLLTNTLRGRVIAVDNFEPSIYGMELQRKNLLSLIQQHVKERYLSEKFRKFQEEKADLEKRRPEQLKPFGAYIESQADQILNKLPRDALMGMTFNQRAEMAQNIARDLNRQHTIKNGWQEALLRVIEDTIREKADRLVTQGIRDQEEQMLKKVREEGDRMERELRDMQRRHEEENKQIREGLEKDRKDMAQQHQQRMAQFAREKQELQKQVEENQRRQAEFIRNLRKKQKKGFFGKVIGAVTDFFSGKFF